MKIIIVYSFIKSEKTFQYRINNVIIHHNSIHKRIGGSTMLLLLCFALWSYDLLPRTLYILFNYSRIYLYKFLPPRYCFAYYIIFDLPSIIKPMLLIFFLLDFSFFKPIGCKIWFNFGSELLLTFIFYFYLYGIVGLFFKLKLFSSTIGSV